MSGRYENAPLVYVSALISTSGLPQLVGEQPGVLQQLMILQGLPVRHVSEGQSLSLDLKVSEGQQPSSSSEMVPFRRVGFFNTDATESLILDDRSIEFRTTKYVNYNGLCDRMAQLFSSLFEKIDVYNDVVSSELILNYVDVIIPYPSRKVSDYFSNANSLPMNFLGDIESEDIQRIGSVEVSRVVNPNQKVNITLEQLPIVEKKIPKFLPNSMIEPDSKFGMPLFVKANAEVAGDTCYALLLTQSMRLLSKRLGDIDVNSDFEALHEMTKETFKNIINREVCNADWGYIKG